MFESVPLPAAFLSQYWLPARGAGSLSGKSNLAHRSSGVKVLNKASGLRQLELPRHIQASVGRHATRPDVIA